MKIYEVTCINEAVISAFNKLIPQLAPGNPPPDKGKLEEIIGSDNTKIFVAEEDEIRGTLTMVIQKTPSGSKAWIEDVIVDSESRGKGIGEKLIRFAVDYAVKKEVNKIDLTSGYERSAANKLYQKLGFRKRETNVYRMTVNGR